MSKQEFQPSERILKFLRLICPDHLYEEIEGDLIEKFNRDLKSSDHSEWSDDYKLWRAKRRLLWNVIRFFRPGILLRNKFSNNQSHLPMFKNYFITSLRHIRKSKVNFAFKLGGLTLALLSFLIIAIYVSYQLSFDRYHEDYQDIYRVNSEWRENGEIAKYAIAPNGIGPALKEQFPEVKSVARLRGSSRYLVKYEDKSFRFNGFVEADSSIFDVLTFQFLKGNRRALNHPGSIVLTQSLARQIFGDEEPIGKSISFIDRFGRTFEVTAIIEDMPNNSHMDINAFLPFDALRDSTELAMDPWGISIDGSNSLYVRLNRSKNPDELASKAEPFVRNKITKSENGLEKEYAIFLQPVADIYLAPQMYAEFCAKGNRTYVYVFCLLAIFLVAIASINYINLSIADFHSRSKEIGVRKVLGARRKQIATQVVVEASFILSASLLFSVGLLYFLFPKILNELDGNLQISMLFQPEVMILIGAVMTLLIIFSCAFPAYRLMVSNPIGDLKARSGFGGNSSVGKILLFAQFTISIFCISATLIVGNQIEFIQARDPGYQRHNMIVVYTPDRFPPEKAPLIKEEFKKLKGVEAVSYSIFRIAGAGYYRDWYNVELDGEMKKMMLNEVFFDHDFFEATGIKLVAGRSFDPNKLTDSHTAFIVNETAVREFGWDDPIGKKIGCDYIGPGGEKWEGTIIGVVKDFNVYSLHKKIEPLVMRLPWSDWPGQCIHIKINGPLDQAITSIKRKYEEILPDFVLDYSIIDDIYNKQYQGERKAFAALQMSTWIIVLISSLGIFSLSIYLSVRRMKEFGIRKLLGATTRQISFLHVSHFLKIALIANSIALPITYWVMEEWLKRFAYRNELSGFVFVLVAIISFLLITVTAGYSAWKAGRLNPMDVIKME